MKSQGWPDRSELAARLAMLAIPRLSGRLINRLLARYGSARAALGMLEQECGRDIAELARSGTVRERTRRALAAVEAQGIRVLAVDGPDYPHLLRARLDEDAPPLLFALGDPGALSMPGIAVVGCRNASEYGLDVAAQIGDAAGRAGAALVSGVALGIDAAAHTAALEAGGTTIGVLGCGVDVYYPRRNMQLQDRIAVAGLLLSELLPGEPPRRYQFPHRNRIIAALSRGVVVVEAGEKSGALSTAGHAMEQGVPLFAVPNAVDRPHVQGILGLFEDGVPPYTGVRALLEQCGVVQLGAPLPEAEPDALPRGAVAQRIWSAVTRDPVHVDVLAGRAGMAAHDALAVLLQLELDGHVAQHAGARFSRARSRRNRQVAAG